MTCLDPTPSISAPDRALLLAVTDPGVTHVAVTDPGVTHVAATDPLDRANFLARPDIRPHLEALRTFHAFRAEIERDYLTRQTAQLLLDVARATQDLVEKRRAATAIIRLLQPPAPRAPGSQRPRAAREDDDRARSAPVPFSPPRSLREAPEHTAAPAPSAPPPTAAHEPANQTTPPAPSVPVAPAPASTPSLDLAPTPSDIHAAPVPQTAAPPMPPVPPDQANLAPAGRQARNLSPRRTRAGSLALAAGAPPRRDTS